MKKPESREETRITTLVYYQITHMHTRNVVYTYKTRTRILGKMIECDSTVVFNSDMIIWII